MNILHVLLISISIIGCGGTVATVNHSNKTPNLERHIVKDDQACSKTDYVWETLSNSYSIGERSIDNFNSITFLSLSIDVYNIILYYKNVTNITQTRPDDAMDIKIANVPKKDGTMDDNKGFLIQTNKLFFNSGYYYVEIDKLCYRGEFPKNNSVKDEDIYKTVKLVVN